MTEAMIAEFRALYMARKEADGCIPAKRAALADMIARRRQNLADHLGGLHYCEPHRRATEARLAAELILLITATV